MESKWREQLRKASGGNSYGKQVEGIAMESKWREQLWKANGGNSYGKQVEGIAMESKWREQLWKASEREIFTDTVPLITNVNLN